jgi:hypothetical protein
MTIAAQPESKLSIYNRRYLALRVRIDQETRAMRYPAELIEQLTTTRNVIVELQNARRRSDVKGGV